MCDLSHKHTRIPRLVSPRISLLETIQLAPRVPPGPPSLVALFALASVIGRYRKGKTTLMGKLWWEVHEDSMIICAEALLPLAITAIFTTGGPHNSSHAKWGEDMYERMRNPGLRRREETIDTVRGA